MTPTIEVERYVASRSGGEPYRMVRENGRWTHADTRCPAFANGRACHHITSLEEEQMGSVPEERALTAGNPLGMVERVDLDEIVRDFLPEPGLKANGQHPWIYEFKSGGQNVVGVSSDGVDDAMRALAFKGETIRVLYARLDRDDAEYGYFVASAARYAISPTGQEICLDSTIRGKRVGKKQMAYGKLVPDENWYEKGITKAARNVCEALLPEALKQEIIRRAKAAQAPGARTALPARTGSTPPPPEPDTVDAEYRAAADGDEHDPLNVLYSLAKSDTATHFAALSEFQKELRKLGQATVPSDMAGWTMRNILNALSGAA